MIRSFLKAEMDGFGWTSQSMTRTMHLLYLRRAAVHSVVCTTLEMRERLGAMCGPMIFWRRLHFLVTKVSMPWRWALHKVSLIWLTSAGLSCGVQAQTNRLNWLHIPLTLQEPPLMCTRTSTRSSSLHMATCTLLETVEFIRARMEETTMLTSTEIYLLPSSTEWITVRAVRSWVERRTMVPFSFRPVDTF